MASLKINFGFTLFIEENQKRRRKKEKFGNIPMRHCILDSRVAQGRTYNSCSSGLLTHLSSPFKLIAKEGKAEYSKQEKAADLPSNPRIAVFAQFRCSH